MFAAVSDHVFIDGGHTIDFTNKAFEALELVGPGARGDVLPTLVAQTTRAQRSEEFSEWRHPHDLVALAAETTARLQAPGPTQSVGTDVGAIAWQLLADEPLAVADALIDGARDRARPTRSSAARSRTPPRCASSASTRATTTPTGTRCTTRSRPRTRCIRRCAATRRPSCAARPCKRRCASISTASSTCPPPVSRRPRAAASRP